MGGAAELSVFCFLHVVADGRHAVVSAFDATGTDDISLGKGGGGGGTDLKREKDDKMGDLHAGRSREGFKTEEQLLGLQTGSDHLYGDRWSSFGRWSVEWAGPGAR